MIERHGLSRLASQTAFLVCAGKGIEFEPSRARLEAIPPEERSTYLVQQRMRFEPTIDTPFGLTQAEIRILYMWPDEGVLTPALSLVRLGTRER